MTPAGDHGAPSGGTAVDGPPVDGGRTRVVIAEDEAIIRLDLKEILLSAGYDVVGETGRGDQAVELVDQHRPDLAILDIKMPGMDGVRAAREITTRHRVAVLVLTAFSQRDLIEDARDAGVAAYLVKPFRREELLPAIAEVMTRTRQEWAIDAEIAALAQPAGGDRAEDKIATRRVVDEAKGVLMDRHGLSEPDAFAFVQRTAMQTRARMRDVAQRVVDGDLVP
ncbi:MAG TPA: response regulator [Acidimicrobiales bacterium]|nr:response regulator [Acidimicrobiales bacterium]